MTSSKGLRDADSASAELIAREAALLEADSSVGNLRFDGEKVGAHLGVDNESREYQTHYFATSLTGYPDWRWAVTLAFADEQSAPTVCDVVLLPGPEALLPPKWVPYAERVTAADVLPGTLVPTSPDDERLVPGYAALPTDEELDPAQLWELGLGRVRVLSPIGRDLASDRWINGEYGPDSDFAKSAPKACASCAFFLPIAGSLRSAFGVCANATSPADGHVVAVNYGCGAHSEALVH
jgi:hypothetical protein